MNQYLEMFSGAGAAAWMVISVILLIVAYITFRSYVSHKKRIDTSLPIDESYESVSTQVSETNNETQKPESQVKQILGTGNLSCICFRKIKGINVIDFTTIPNPVGEIYQLDPSCPSTGSAYIVKEADNGNIIDYDPRETEYKTENSPEVAWFAINWDIVKNVYFVPVKWWKSTSVWFAGFLLGIVFICSLVVLGG
jgi:hypothetical protein